MSTTEVKSDIQPAAATSYSQVACIGAGFSAIGVGSSLKRWYGITDITFFERRESSGGTWLANNYPGQYFELTIWPQEDGMLTLPITRRLRL
jgi:cation diffusion facilitator CzcD-associated flavoprotein CzcO